METDWTTEPDETVLWQAWHVVHKLRRTHAISEVDLLDEVINRYAARLTRQRAEERAATSAEPPAATAAAASPKIARNQALLFCDYTAGIKAAVKDLTAAADGSDLFKAMCAVDSFIRGAGLRITKEMRGGAQHGWLYAAAPFVQESEYDLRWASAAASTPAAEPPVNAGEPAAKADSATVLCNYGKGVDAVTEALDQRGIPPSSFPAYAVDAFLHGAGLKLSRPHGGKDDLRWISAIDVSTQVPTPEAPDGAPELTDATNAMIRDAARSMVHDMVQAAISDYDQMLPTRVRRIIETSQAHFGP